MGIQISMQANKMNDNLKPPVQGVQNGFEILRVTIKSISRKLLTIRRTKNRIYFFQLALRRNISYENYLGEL